MKEKEKGEVKVKVDNVVTLEISANTYVYVQLGVYVCLLL